MQSEIRECAKCGKNFTIETDDFAFYEKLGVPAPTWCPHCRFIRKASFINERFLYKRNCGHCGKSIVSMYHPDIQISALCAKCYLSDVWDARDYGREYDFSRNFFEQFKELKYAVPQRALDQNERNGEGCEYSNLCYSSKGIYLSYDVIGSEYIKYSSHVLKRNKNCLDSMIITGNDRGYELVRSADNFNSSFLVDCDQCVESNFLYDCLNCVNCCLSSNLRNKSYYFRNKQLTKEEYDKALDMLKLGTHSGQLKTKNEFKEMSKKAIHRYAHIKNCVNSVGDLLENSKNIYHGYALADGSENTKYAYMGGGVAKDSQDLIYTGRIEECYEFTLGGRGGSRIIFSLSCAGGNKNLFYCDSCRGCSDCFGCISLVKKQYCVFNKQYSKEEYGALVEKIKKHMCEMPYIDMKGMVYKFGECFPTEISIFAYNETIAFEETPLSKEESLAEGYRWRETEEKKYTATVQAENLPDNINDVKDGICNETLECPNKGTMETQCTSAYRILPDELVFYRQMNLPLPRLCPNCRYYERKKWINHFEFYKRQCMCDLESHGHAGACPNQFETMYAPERPEKIFCDSCYKKEVY